MLTLRDVNDHPEGAAALQELDTAYIVSEAAGGLLLSQRDADCRLFLYDLPAVLGAARRNAARREREARFNADPSSRRYRAEDLASGPTDLVSAREVIAQLEDRITRLQAIRRQVGEQREHWRLRAMQAEERQHTPDAADRDAGDSRYRALRRFLARRLHPDHAQG